MSPEYHRIAGAGEKIRDACQHERSQIDSSEELTGATALFAIPMTNPCIAENIIFLCDIMTANNSRQSARAG